MAQVRSKTNREWVRILGGVLAGLWLAAGVVAQTGSPPTGEEEEVPLAGEEENLPRFKEEVRVVATPIQEAERVTPFAAQVATVSARQVEEMGAGDLAAALRRLPGVTISRYNVVGAYGGGDGGAIYVRGQGSGRPGAEISTLVDGVPRFVGVWTHPLLDTLASDAAEAIEVFKSAQPVLLGSMAFAGINLESKRVREEGSRTRLVGGWGELGTSTGVVEHGAKRGPLDYYLQASRRASDGHRPAAGGRVASAYGRVGLELGGGWSSSLQLHAADAWAEDPGREGAPPRPVVPRFAVEDALTIFTLSRVGHSSEGSVKVYHHLGDIDWRQWDNSRSHAFTTVTEFSSYGVRARQQFHLPKRSTVVAGVDWERYGGSVKESRPTGVFTFPRRLLRNAAGYVTAARSFGSAVEVTPSAGVRWISTADFGGQWGGQAGVVVRHTGWELHANWARAVNLPGVYAAVLFTQWGRGESWRQLDPELLHHAEVGVGRRLGEGAQVRVTAFSDQVRDALRFVPPPPPPPAFANLGRYTVRGVEGVLSAGLGQRAAVFAGVTYLDPQPADVPNAPRWAVVAGTSWAPLERLRVHLDAQWVDDQAVLNPRYASTQTRVDAYTLVHLRAAYRLLSGAGPLELYVQADNLTDSAFAYRPGYPAPGRVVSGGFEVRL